MCITDWKNYQNQATTSIHNIDVALQSLPKKKKTKLSPISSHSIVNKARENVQVAVRKYQNNQSEFSRKAITKAQRELDKAYLTAETEFIQGKISQLERKSITKQHASAWKTINEITGRNSKPSITIKGGSQEKRKENWLAHFRNLLGNPATTPDDQQLPKIQISESLDISTEPFTTYELLMVIKHTKSNKSPGLDHIPAIIWKDPTFHDLLLNICN